MEHLHFNTHFNYAIEDGEFNSLPSCTEPDLSMSIRDIISRMAQGIPCGGSSVYYPDDEDDPIPPTQQLDYELHDYYLDSLDNQAALRASPPAPPAPPALSDVESDSSSSSE